MVDKNNNDILLSDYQIGRQSNQMMTFNENLTESEHDRYDLTFDIVDSPSSFFPIAFKLSSLLRTGRELKLFKDGELTNYISLIISSISLNIQKENNIFSITAQDYASYVWSKNNTGLNFDSLTDEEFNNLSIKYNLFNTASYLLSRDQISNPIDSSLDITEQSFTQTITESNIKDTMWTSDGKLTVFSSEANYPNTRSSSVTIDSGTPTTYFFQEKVELPYGLYA